MNDLADPTRETDELPPRSETLIGRLQIVLRWARRLIFQSLPYEEAKEVRKAVEEEGKLTERYALMCALSAGIATLGLLQSSSAVVIGAMLVSPLMGPIAALGFGFASVDGRRIRDAAKVVGVGALVGVGIGILITALSPIRNATPEIIARTAPTLLDLAVAVLSGLAGGYATVHRKGETAIGVAIATALMPPLATLGYSIAVLRFDFALGALLLFLTNLAAIAFSFALVARLRGVARPLRNVEFKPQFVALGVAAFLALATPLALTLRRVTQESVVTTAVRREVASQLHIDASQIAQLNVSCPLLEPARISVTAVTPAYRPEAETALVARLSEIIGREPEFALRQIVAADTRTQTQAMIDTALEQVQETSASDVAIVDVRTAARLPIIAAWIDDKADTIALSAAQLDSLSLGDYRAEETRLHALFPSKRILIIPPFRVATYVAFAREDEGAPVALQDAIWALRRWGVQHVAVTGLDGRSANQVAIEARAQVAGAQLQTANIAFELIQGDRAAADAAVAACGQACAYGVMIRATVPISAPNPSAAPAP